MYENKRITFIFVTVTPMVLYYKTSYQPNYLFSDQPPGRHTYTDTLHMHTTTKVYKTVFFFLFCFIHYYSKINIVHQRRESENYTTDSSKKEIKYLYVRVCSCVYHVVGLLVSSRVYTTAASEGRAVQYIVPAFSYG